MWLALEHNGGRARLAPISRYLEERVRFKDRFVGALQQLDVRAHVLWAQDDPVAVRAIGDKLATEIPGARHTRLPALGHYPMLEDPDRWSDAALDFLQSG
jgi:pimeloyl-ACP methyl ester carboxylesterase